MNIKLSVIIPSYKDKYLPKTINSLLENSALREQLEIIVCLDGYWLSPELIVQDPRVRYVHLGKNRGMRGAINAGVAVSRGEFIARSDEHIMFGPGWDKILTDSCKDNWIMTAKRFYLNPVEWKLMDLPPVECEKLVIQDCGNGVRKFAGQKWDSRAKELKDMPIIESMAMQGSFWCMSREHWDSVIGELQSDGYGPLYGDSHEMIFKTWKAGGKLMVNKNMWFAHKHRSFSRTHADGTPENPADKINGWKYAMDTWGGYYEEIKKKWNI